MKLRLYFEDDPVLHQRAAPVEKITNKTRRLIADMFETMYAAKGIGLAANQVGVLQRVIVLDPRIKGVKPLAMINPEIIEREGECDNEEGCLSCPGLYAVVRRAARVRVRALDPAGAVIETDATGLFAAAIQHEIDHLDGILFIDRLTPTERVRVERQRAARQPL